MTRSPCPAVVLAGLLAACAGGGDDRIAAVVRDSAGITIVENADPAWGPGEAWTVDSTFLISIGGDELDPLYDLGQVGGALRLSDGRIVVANGATSEIRFYDREGGHLLSAGRKGQGPGEYQAIQSFWQLPGDSLLVYDAMGFRLTVVGPDGGTGRTLNLGGQSGAPVPGEGGRISMAIPMAVGGGRSVLGGLFQMSMETPPGEQFRDTMGFLRYGLDGALLDTVTRLPGVEMEMRSLSFNNQSFPVPSPVPLGRTTTGTMSPDGAGGWFAKNEAYEIDYWAAGNLSRRIRVLIEPSQITEEDKAAHRIQARKDLESGPAAGMLVGPIKDQMLRAIEEARYPETMPFVAGILTDASGNLWVEEVQRPGVETRRYAVFSPEGVLQGRVTMPERFRPLSFGSDEVVGVWEDPDDVQFVRVYRLNK